MSACPQDETLVDLVYGELSEGDRVALERHAEECARCSTELARLGGTRAAMARLPDEEPPAAIRESLLQEAARASHVAAAQPVEAPTAAGWWTRFPGAVIDSWLRPAMQHPALAAAATLIIVIGVAGVLRWQGRDVVVDQLAEPTAAPPAGGGADEPAPEPSAAAPEGEARATEQELDDDVADLSGLAAELEEAEEARVREDPAARRKQERSRQASGRAARGSARGGAGIRSESKASDGFAPGPATDDELASGSFGAGPAGATKQREAQEPPRDQAPADREAGGSAEQNFAEPPPPTRRAQAPRRERARSRAPESAPAQGESADDAAGAESDSDARQDWLRATSERLAAAARAERCGDAAALANDIRDREPRYYRERIAKAEVLAPCRKAVAAERQRRQRARADEAD